MQIRKPQKPLTKKVDVMKGKEKMREVEVPLTDPEIQDGDMNNYQKSQSLKSPAPGTQTVGLSLGVTLNVGDFQSARIDCFIIRHVPDVIGAEERAFSEISGKLNKEIKRQAEIVLADDDDEPEHSSRKPELPRKDPKKQRR